MKNFILTLGASLLLGCGALPPETTTDPKRNICFKWLNTDAEIPIDGEFVQIAYTNEDTVYLKPLVVKYGVLEFSNVADYKYFLINEGYSESAAELIAKTEFKLISESAEYKALMED